MLRAAVLAAALAHAHASVWKFSDSERRPAAAAAAAAADAGIGQPPRPCPSWLLSGTLENYKKLHRDIVAGTRPGGFTVFECPPNVPCGGWGDRVKGILQGFVAALLTDTAYIIQNTRTAELAQFYNPNHNINWGAKPNARAGWQGIDCLNSRCVCSRNKISEAVLARPGTSFHFRSNYLCVREVMTHHLLRERAHALGLCEGRETLRALTDFLLQPHLKLAQEISTLRSELKADGGWYMGIHFRFGDAAMTKNLDSHTHRQPLTDLPKYERCLQTLRQDHYRGVRKMNFFIATDNEKGKKHLLKHVRSLPGTGVALTADGVGGAVGHVDKDPGLGANVFRRVLLDFEMIRRSDAVIVGLSGLSLTAGMTGWMDRIHGLADPSTCEDPWVIDFHYRP